MTIEQLKQACRDSIKNQGRFSHTPGIQLVSKDRHQPLPRKGFPRPELLCDTERGSVWVYPAKRLLAALENMQERWVEWIEPFGPNNEPVYLRVPESTAIAVAKDIAEREHGFTYTSDADALDEFMVVHWANFVSE
jgi:hypothetical protein